VPILADISLIASDKVRGLAAWWVTHSTSGALPDRRDFDPGQFARLLPNMLIADVEPDPFRIRYRLVGTKVADVMNIDFTGRYLDELLDGASDTPWLDYYASAYASRTPIYGSVTEPTMAGGTFTFEFGMFPVTLGDGSVRQFLSIGDYFEFQLTSAELMPWSLRTSIGI